MSGWGVKNQFFMIFDALANKIFPGGGVENFVTRKNYIFLPGNFNSGFVNKGFLFATSSRKIESYVVESLGMFINYTFYFYKNQIILAESQCSYCCFQFLGSFALILFLWQL